MTPNDIARRLETKAFAYGIGEAVATLLGEYVKDLLDDAPTCDACPACEQPTPLVCPVIDAIDETDEDEDFCERCGTWDEEECEFAPCAKDDEPAPTTKRPNATETLFAMEKTIRYMALRLDAIEFKCDEIQSGMDLGFSIANDATERVTREISATNEIRSLLARK